MSIVDVFDCERCGSHDELPEAGGYLTCSCDRRGALGDAGLVVTHTVGGAIQWRLPLSEVMAGRAP